MSESPTSLASQSSTERQVSSSAGKRNRILVFSPDRDLAQSLSMLFEDHFDITCETSLTNLQKRIASVAPSLLIVDLHTFSSDVMHELSIVEGNTGDVPVVIMRAYNRLRSDVEELVQRTADVVFYKPLNAEEVVRTIHDLLKVAQ
jgi:DNA-binding NtrC family response regulator